MQPDGCSPLHLLQVSPRRRRFYQVQLELRFPKEGPTGPARRRYASWTSIDASQLPALAQRLAAPVAAGQLVIACRICLADPGRYRASRVPLTNLPAAEMWPEVAIGRFSDHAGHGHRWSPLSRPGGGSRGSVWARVGGKVNCLSWSPRLPRVLTHPTPKAQRMRSKRGAFGCESRRFSPRKRKSRKPQGCRSLRGCVRRGATQCETMRLSAKVAEEGLEPPTRGL